MSEQRKIYVEASRQEFNRFSAHEQAPLTSGETPRTPARIRHARDLAWRRWR